MCVCVCYLERLLLGVEGDEEHLHHAVLADRKRDAEVAEGVEGDRDLVALGADQRGLEEAVEGVHDHRVVTAEVVPPSLLSHFLFGYRVKR